MLPGLRPARVRVRLTDGRVLTAEVLTNKGDTEDPYSAVDVQDKFRELAEPVWGPSHAERIIAEVQRIDTASDIRGLTGLRSLLPRGLVTMSFRTRLLQNRVVVAPGVYDPLTASWQQRRASRPFTSPARPSPIPDSGGRISGSSP